MKVLVIDVGGTNVKVLATGMDPEQHAKIPSGPEMDAATMADRVLEATAGWDYEAVSIGLPTPVLLDRVQKEPHNLAPGWIGYDFAAKFGKPVKIINDAAMQALGSHQGGTMLFLGLGTGLGAALVIRGVVAPLEVAHLPYRKGRTFEDYVGLRGLERLGPRKWRKAVRDVSARLKAALVADYVVFGGGNSKRLKPLPDGYRLGDNSNAFVGGERLWRNAAEIEGEASVVASQDATAAPPGE